MARPMKCIDYNKIYYNTQDKAFRVIKEVEPKYDKNGKLVRKILIRFESGYETETFLSKLSDNVPIPIKDCLSPSVYGVGCVGYADPVLHESMYKRWSSMLARCYDPTNHRYNAYGGAGVTVCTRWLRFDLFLEDIVNLPGYQDMIDNPHIQYQLDKDIRQQGIPTNQKVYSPETCMWVPAIENTIQRIIDNKPNYINNQYYGVQITEAGTYSVRIRDGNKNVNCGTYTNIIAAANAYNHFAIVLHKTLLNDVPFMPMEECVKYLVQPIQMLVDDNKIRGIHQINGGNYIARLTINGVQESFGPYTDKIIAASEHNHFSFGMGRPILNKVPYISHEECSKYLTKPRIMCAIIN